MTIVQSPLPYEMHALEPHISAETMDYHYNKHHAGYVSKLNELTDGMAMADMDLESIIGKAREQAIPALLNNALQIWNHSFLWESMSPDGGGKPEGQILELVERDFGDFEAFTAEFRSSALSQFGSGWTWLIDDHGRLRITSTGNADSPVGTHVTPLLVLDVWEHAYYIDYRNNRKAYVDTFLDSLINWKFAAANLEVAQGRNAA